MIESNSDIPVYIQVEYSAAYALPADSGYGWCGYILPEGVQTTATLTPSEAFNNQNGHFLFAPEEPLALKSNPKTFLSSFYTFIDQVGGGNFVGRALLWLPKAILPDVDDFDRYGIRFVEGTIISPGWTVKNNLNIHLGSHLRFYINNGCTVSYDEGLNAIQFKTGSVTTNKLGYQDSISNDTGIGMPDGSRMASQILTGDHAGSLQFTSTYKAKTALKYFSTGFGYSVKYQGVKEPLFYSVFDANQLTDTPIDLVTVLDLLDTTNDAMTDADLANGFFRTGYAFAPQGLNIASWFRTSKNHPITLRPLGGSDTNGQPKAFSGGLIFYETPELQHGAPIYGMTLVGDYALTVPGYKQNPDEMQMLCGLFGMEWLSFMPYDSSQSDDNNDRLRFLPCQGGYAPVFPFTTANLVNPGSGEVVPRLDLEYRISWANLVAGASQTAYSAQPEGSALYGNPSGDDVTLLSSKPPATKLPTTAGFAFPIVPYAGTITAPTGLDLNSFESEILSATRKTQISAATIDVRQKARADNQIKLKQRAQATTPEPPQRITTPQGLLVDLANDGVTYEKVLLARSQESDSSFLDFALKNPTTDMLEALQTNQLFLVGVNPAPFSSDGASFLNKIVINDWNFVADVGEGAQATSYHNVMLIKFCTGSLKERVTNPNRWTMPESFSLINGATSSMSGLAYTGLSQWLQNYIAEAEGKAEVEGPNGLYSNFVKLVQDPNWNGIIVLNANLPLDSLPSQIAGIAAGIDYSRFQAHHFGASVSRVKYESGSLDVQGISSLFGLIDYQNPAYEAAVAGGASQGTSIQLPTKNGYAFSVLQLQVLFVQSRMATFNSYIQLSMDTLFGSDITNTQFSDQASPINAMVLKGTALQQNGTTTYVYEQTGGYLFGLDSNVLPMISVNRVQFNTLGASDSGVTLNSRFLMWGRLNFALLETNAVTPTPFDLLSFGSDKGEALGNQGLAYANLDIDMSFPAATPNATNFAFDTGHLSFDLAGSTVRGQSLFKGFALQIKKFIAATKSQQPKDYNFLTVQPQGLSLQPLTGDWYGISFKVTMGTPGALVSGTGFESDLLLAWSPSSTTKEKNAALFVGLSLPGAAPGASAFSLQGVFKVSTGPIKLLYQDVPNDASGSKFFNLQLTNIGIKILGIAKLPPGATIQFFLFGDPSNTGSLGWYAAYVQDQSSKKSTPMLTQMTEGSVSPSVDKVTTKQREA